MSSSDRRLQSIIGQLSSNQTAATATTTTANKQPKFTAKDDDIVIIAPCRTAIAKAKRGGFKDTFMEDLLSTVMKGVLDRSKIDPKLIDDICVGNVLGASSQRANECRIAAFLAGMPDTVSVSTCNRQCSSGLQAIAHIASSIKSGTINIGMACGVETMSLSPFKWEGNNLNTKIFLNQQTKDCLLPMGITSENVSGRFGVNRKEQDELAVMSHQRAAAAIKSGKFKDEIVPVKTKVKDAKTGEMKDVVIDTDEGVRADTTMESLSKLNPAFQKGGSTTAGNSSQVSDGAAACLMMTRAMAKKLNMPVMGVFRGFAAVGVDPSVMGIGPAVAIPAVLKKLNLTTDDIDVYEINEAFASQAVYSVKKLGLSWDKVNVNGGAIALGHPLGCTGCRQTATLLHEMHRRKGRLGVVSMCIGSGMGAAAVFEVEN